MKSSIQMFLFTLVLLPAMAQSISAVADADPNKLDLDYAHVLAVEANRQSDGWRVAATVRHRDEGWDHYADLWLIADAESGTVYGRRPLAHPHDTEQHFTRSLSGIDIPAGVRHVVVKARCNRHGFGGTELTLTLP